jgi:Eco57I restriction-modification methylase
MSLEIDALNVILDDGISQVPHSALDPERRRTLIYDAERLVFQLIASRVFRNQGNSYAFRSFDDEDVKGSLSHVHAELVRQGERNSAASELFSPSSIDISDDTIQAVWDMLAKPETPRNTSPNDRYSILQPFSYSLARIVAFQPTVRKSGSSIRIEFVPSATSKRTSGTYYTPIDFARRITRDCVSRVIERRGREAGLSVPQITAHGIESLPDSDKRIIRNIILGMTLLDPACGTGHMLVAGAEVLGEYLRAATNESKTGGETLAMKEVVRSCLYGVDKDRLALLLTRVILWSISGTSPEPAHFKCGDSLLGHTHGKENSQTMLESLGDEQISWSQDFASEMGGGGFSVVATNPPWDRVKVMEREIPFSYMDELPETAFDRREALRKAPSEIREQFKAAKERIKSFSQRIKETQDYSWALKGELNLYKLFAERALALTSDDGCCGLVVPTGIATDFTSKDFFWSVIEKGQLVSLFDFENRKKKFQGVDGRFRFCLLTLDKAGGVSLPKFCFFAEDDAEIDAAGRTFEISPAEIAQLNPTSRTPPIVRSKSDFELLKRLSKAHPLLNTVRKEWGLRYLRMFDMSNDSRHFLKLNHDGLESIKSDGTLSRGPKKLLRVYEGKMIASYNHRAASAVTRNGVKHRPGGSISTSLENLQNPAFTVAPRFFVEEDLVRARIGDYPHRWFPGYKDITSATNERTMIATVLPYTAVGNKIPLLLSSRSAREVACLLANLNSFAYDFVCKQKIGNITLNWYIVKQTPVVPPSLYRKFSIDGEVLLDWISSRIAELTFTSNDMMEWGTDLGFSTLPYSWNPERRRQILVDLDALFMVLYRSTIDEALRIMGSFPIVREKEIKRYGSYLLAEQIVERMREIQPKLHSQMDKAVSIPRSM